MSMLSEKGYMSGTKIILVIWQRCAIKLSSGTVYPVLYKLEGEGKIKRLPKRRKRLYALTAQGKEILNAYRKNMVEISPSLLFYEQELGT